MTPDRLDDAALDVVSRAARTHHAWLGRAVPDVLLQDIYELYKWGPTSANCSPQRVVFVRSPQAKERLLACMNSGIRGEDPSGPGDRNPGDGHAVLR